MGTINKQLALLGLSLSYGGSSLACSCMYSSVESRFDRATYVFTAVVTETSLVPVETVFEGFEPVEGEIVVQGFDVLKGSIQVTTIIKGIDSSSLDAVYTPRSGEMCGVNLRVGAEYLFFAERHKIVGLCGGNLIRGQRRQGVPGFDEALETVRQLQNESAPEDSDQ